MTKSQHSEQMLRAHLIPSDFGIPNQWAVQSKYYADARIEQDRASLAAQVEALTADLHAAEVRVGSLLCERSDLIQQLMDERDSLRAELQIKNAECDLFQHGCDIRDAALDKLKHQKPVAWSVTVGNDYKNCIEITHCESDAVAQYEASTEGGFESIYTLHKLYDEVGAQPSDELSVLQADAERSERCPECFSRDCNGECSGDGAMGD